MTETSPDSQQRRMAAAFFQDEVESINLGGRVRAAAAAVIAVWVVLENADPIRSSWYGGLILLFGAVGLALYALARTGRYRSWMKYAVVAFDAALFVFIVVSPVPGSGDSLPVQMNLSQGIFIYAFIILLSACFIYTPRFALWAGACLAAAWALGYLWVARLPDSVSLADLQDSITDIDSLWLAISQPGFVNPYLALRDTIVVLVGAGIIAAAMQRARNMVQREAAAERRRANLARYFSPNLVDQLAETDSGIGAERRQTVAVLFADIVGFTRLCEAASPGEVMELLRGFRTRMEAAIFAHGGTLDKFVGDGVMATFGTLRAGPDDAADALRCARDMRAAIAAWNAVRGDRGQAALRVGIGVDLGDCVVGDVGGTQLEFTVIGDPVNVASRLEHLTRELDADIVLSAGLAAAVRARGETELLQGFRAHDPVRLRGRAEPVAIELLGPGD